MHVRTWLLILLLAGGAHPLAAQERIVVTATNANLHTAPDFSATALGELARGTVLHVLDRPGEWVRVFANDQVGFVHGALTGPLASSAPATPAQQQPAQPPYRGGTAGQQVPLQVATGVPDKSPGTPRLFAVLITGGGHLYAGETTKGLTLMGISLGAWLAGTALSSPSCSFSGFDASCDDGLGPLYLGAAVAGATWIYGILDADDAARRQNTRLASMANADLRPHLSSRSDGATRVGLSVSLP